MAGIALEGKKCCGFPRKVVACCGVVTLLVAAAVIATLAVVLKPPDDIETIEKNESESATTASEITILSTAVLSPDASSAVNATLSLLKVTNDSSYLLAINDFRTSADCAELEVRLLGATSTSAAEGLLVVPLTADTTSTAEFTEELGADFDAELYEKAAIWCIASDSTEEQLGTSTDFVTPTTLEGGDMVVRQASLVGGGSYTTDGLVQIIGSSSIVDGALVTTYSMRFEDIDVSAGPDVFLYLTTDPNDPDDVDAEGSLTVLVEGAERGTFSFTGTFSQDLPDGFVSPEEYVAAVVWCDQFSVFFGSGLFEDV